MPELPEVETVRRDLAPILRGALVTRVVVRQPRLRWEVPAQLSRGLAGQRVVALERRAKYLLLRVPTGTAILHLGMSGSLQLLAAASPPGPHDHVDFELQGERLLRLRDPRRFGAVLWTCEAPERHPLLRHLGPEPLDSRVDGVFLRERFRGRRRVVKAALMDSRIVVGIGNIYASEVLFAAGIHPTRAAGAISQRRCDGLARSIREVISAAIAAGGTTLRDFSRGDGSPGHYQRQLQVYGRGGSPCRRCGRAVRTRRIGQRSTYYCPGCQR